MTTLGEFVERFREAHRGNGESNTAAQAVWNAMSPPERESLGQLLFAATPVWDGDHISKQARDSIIAAGLAVRVCHHGEQGYTSATYPAYSIFRRAHSEQELRDCQKMARDRFRRLAQKTVSRHANWLAKMWPGHRKQLSVLLGDGPKQAGGE